MSAPTYTHDLVDIDLCNVGGKTWAEPTATGWIAGSSPGDNDDNPFQGAGCKSKAYNADGVGGMMVNNTTAISLPTDGAILGWFCWAAPGSLNSDVDGGIRMMAGSDLVNFLSWDLGGKTSYVYGGWINYAFNTGIAPDDTVGTGLGNSQYIGAAVNNFNSIFKGDPFFCDAFRYGRGTSRMSGGQLANYATFSGYAAINDLIANRWGLIQSIIGGYMIKGLVLFGFSTRTTTYRARTSNVATLTTSVVHGFVVGDTVIITGVGGTGYNATAVITVVGSTTTFSYANSGSDEGSTADTGGSINGVVDFEDSNKAIVIQNTNKVTTNFNTFEVRNVSSKVYLTTITITALGTVSKGRWVTTDNADVRLTSCVFTDMNTFGFASCTIITNTTFRRCGIITQNGATLTGCTIDNASDTKAIIVNDISKITNTSFTSDGTGYALEGFGSAGDYYLVGLSFTGYAANGTSGNEAIHVLASLGIVYLYRTGGTAPSIHTAGATVYVISSIPLTVKVQDEAQDPIENAQVGIYKLSDNTQLMNEDTLVTGIATEPYSGSYPMDIVIRVRKSDNLDNPRYFPFSTTGQIISTGFSLTVTLKENEFI